MPQELIQLDARKRLSKLGFIVLIAIATVWTYYAFRWYLGNTMAEYFNTGENSLDLAQVARNLAPNDPLTHWRLGQVSQKRLPLDQAATALAEYEKAVSLSPNDYRMWMALGVAREQAGEVEKAEPALRKSVALAPSYAYPHWYLGNLLLRSGRYDEAFAELRIAGEADPEALRGQLFNLIWQVNGSDIEALKKAVGSNAEARANFAVYLLGQQRRDESIAMWNSLNADEKKANKETGNAIVKALIDNLRFHDAVVIWNELAPTPAYRVEEGRIGDGSFEELLNYGPEVFFGWQVKTAPNMQIGIDPTTGHNGERSLRLLFQVRTQLDAINVSQLVPVAKNATYDFECFVKTSKLQSGGPPEIQIVDANGGAVLATSNVAPSGDTDWNRVALTFKTTEKTEAVAVRLARTSCGEDTPLCPIFGSVWYDDFSFKRTN